VLELVPVLDADDEPVELTVPDTVTVGEGEGDIEHVLDVVPDAVAVSLPLPLVDTVGEADVLDVPDDVAVEDDDSVTDPDPEGEDVWDAVLDDVLVDVAVTVPLTLTLTLTVAEDVGDAVELEVAELVGEESAFQAQSALWEPATSARVCV
jgi:hypothetical protein